MIRASDSLSDLWPVNKYFSYLLKVRKEVIVHNISQKGVSNSFSNKGRVFAALMIGGRLIHAWDSECAKARLPNYAFVKKIRV